MFGDAVRGLYVCRESYSYRLSWVSSFWGVLVMYIFIDTVYVGFRNGGWGSSWGVDR